MNIWSKEIQMDDQSGKIMYAWLMLAILSLVFAGIFALLIAISRTPFVQDIFDIEKNFFYVGLAVHVGLSAVIWFFTFMAVVWTMISAGFMGVQLFNPRLGWSGFCLSALGTVCLIVTVFIGGGRPLQNNYVPVVIHPLYFAGLLLFGTGIFLTAVNTILTILKGKREGTTKGSLSPIPFGALASAVVVIVAIICVGLAYYSITSNLALTEAGYWKDVYYEYLFWGGGHTLQYANTLGMLTVWVLLIHWIFKQSPMNDSTLKVMLSIPFFFSFLGPLVYLITDIDGSMHRESFRFLMRYPIAPPVLIITLSILIFIVRRKSEKAAEKVKKLPWGDPAFSSLVLSVIVFMVGGLFGYLITDANFKVSSHYHGSIGAVTLAFMGLTYYLLPVLKRDIASKKVARIQPYLYGIGQFLFIFGLFWAGSHGVQRKTYGDQQELNNFGKIAGMILSGSGGLLAVIGGAAYAFNVLTSLLTKKQ